MVWSIVWLMWVDPSGVQITLQPGPENEECNVCYVSPREFYRNTQPATTIASSSTGRVARGHNNSNRGTFTIEIACHASIMK
jgi:hypothetical protein